MGSPEAERIREEARGRIAGRPSMVLDGDPIEELARAHERHAKRLEEIIKELTGVGRTNYLGDTSEGRAATHNVGVAVHDHERSVVGSLKMQRQQSLTIAASLRQIGRDLRDAEAENQSAIVASGQ